MKRLEYVVRAIAAGFFIGLGAVACVICSINGKPICGAAMFAVGILVVMEFKFLLFTGYVPTQRSTQRWEKYLLNCLAIWLLNAVGAIILGIMITNTRIFTQATLLTSFKEYVNNMVSVKLNDSLFSVFFLSVLCGIVIALIVKAKTYKNSVLYTVLLIAVFIVCSYEHVVANSFYLFVTNKLFTGSGFSFFIVNMLGNFAGGFLFSFIDKINDNKGSKRESNINDEENYKKINLIN